MDILLHCIVIVRYWEIDMYEVVVMISFIAKSKTKVFLQNILEGKLLISINMSREHKLLNLILSFTFIWQRYL